MSCVYTHGAESGRCCFEVQNSVEANLQRTWQATQCSEGFANAAVATSYEWRYLRNAPEAILYIASRQSPSAFENIAVDL